MEISYLFGYKLRLIPAILLDTKAGPVCDSRREEITFKLDAATLCG